MKNEIVEQKSYQSWEQQRAILKSYIDSGLLPRHIRTVEQAQVIVGIGREIGLPPIAALRSILIIQGNPTVSPAMMLALANRRGILKDYKLEKYDDKAVFTIWIKGRETPHVETFTKADADKLGLSGKDNYQKQPKVMYAWRAISAAMRIAAPEVIFGLYTPEEMGAVIDINPENDLESLAPKQLEKIPSREELLAILSEIKGKLAEISDGDVEYMGALLSELTMGNVTLENMDGLVETHPNWLLALLNKINTNIKQGETNVQEQPQSA